MKCNDTEKNQHDTERSNSAALPHKGIKWIFKGIICLFVGHDWVNYNEHCYICSQCTEVAPTVKI